MIPDPTLLRFRSLEATDFPLLQRWLNTPHVLRWWKEPLTLEQVAAKYLPRIEGREPTRQYLILYGDAAIGSIQAYRMVDYPEYAQAAQVEAGAAGVDLFIGEAAYLYQGLGPEILRRFLRQHVFSDPDVGCCVLGPDPENRAAIRCYEKAGFRYLRTIQVPGEDVPEYLMRLLRAQLDTPDSGGGPACGCDTRSGAAPGPAWCSASRAAASRSRRGSGLSRMARVSGRRRREEERSAEFRRQQWKWTTVKVTEGVNSKCLSGAGAGCSRPS